jgi:aldehyde dehydrogenase (NAD+)
MYQILLKVIPALLVGCTVILKSSEQTPLSALLFGQLIATAGFPPGVFQLVNGYGPNHVGEWLASHPGIDMVSFTGSTRGGKQVSAAAAPTLKRVSLEMGGKGANIIFDLVEDGGDMHDFREAVESGVWGVMSNSGQSCDAPTRMLVHEKYWDFALHVAKEIALSVDVGSAHLEGEHIGPVVSRVQYETIQSYIQSGIEEGAILLVGGLGKPTINTDASAGDDKQKLQQHFDGGFYVRPTVFVNCKPDMKIWQEEIFGPVLCITKFSTEDDAVKLANDSMYGLTHYVHTYDKERRKRLAYKLQSGMVVMNQVELASAAPFGGVKQSGHNREGGLWGLEDFCVVKSISGLNSYEDEDE